VPEQVLASARAAMAGETPQATSLVDPQTQSNWVVVPVHKPALGVFAIEMGQVPRARLTELSNEIERALADASATLDRLDVAHAMQEAELRARAVMLREALIGSVTHGLRTPLASIVGSASVLSEAQPVRSDDHLAELAGIIRDEADRLDRDIQKLLDSTRISSAGVTVHAAWTDPGDIVNAVLANEERTLARHAVATELGDDLPLVHVDPVLVEQALRLILDNAARYSPPGSRVRVAVLAEKDAVKILIEDDGLGLTSEDRQRMFERFYRGDRVGEHTGTGLGLWIAQAFIAACGGSVTAESAGPGRGTQIIVMLPAGAPPDGAPGGGND
jgi:two-component system sensor histidine kinase KdpD